MSVEELCTVRVGRVYSQTPERVFDAWLDPAAAGCFLFATPAGEMTHVEIDGRAGGRFLIVERRAGEEVEHRGEYMAIERPRRLAFRFTVPKYSPLSTDVALEFEAAGAGCALTLIHTGVLPEWAASTEEGWRGILEGLAKVLEEN
ncbi:MAG: SRPBCC domain-containing protein [Terracidiphilus sp.]